MTMTETIVVNGQYEDVEVQRLSDGDELHAREDAVWDRYGTDLSDDDFDFFIGQTKVYYRDDYDTGVSEYTIDDRAGGYAFGWHRVDA